MLVEREREELEVSGNLAGRSYVAGIDDENMTWIIGMFTDLYSDTIRAVVREYTTNARDAQVEAVERLTAQLAVLQDDPEATQDDEDEISRAIVRAKQPIQVSLPSPLSNYFKVRDCGVGLREHDIATIYSRYGSSTKRGTNAQNGMLGIGCKSALTYSDQFTVVSVKDGVKTVCIVSRKPDEVPVMHVVSEDPTTEANGTEVSVVVKPVDISVFADRALQVFAYWEPGTVEVNGKAPERFEGLKLTDDLYVVEGFENAVVMGGVRYPVEPGRLNLGLAHGHALLAFVPIGTVHFAPSREALTYDGVKGKRTLETLADIPGRFREAIQGAVQREVNAATSPAEAIKLVSKWNAITSQTARIRYTWNGKEVPASFRLTKDLNAPSWSRRQFQYVPVANSGRGQTRKMESLQASEWFKTAWITGFELGKFTPQHRRKLEQWCQDNRFQMHDYTRFVLQADDSLLPKEWLDPATIIKFEDINAIKLPSGPVNPGSRLNGRIPGSYDCYVDGEYRKGVEANDIDQQLPVYYHEGNKQSGGYYVAVLTRHVPHYTLVMMPANRVEKFKRNFPTAVTVVQGVRDAHDAWFKALPNDAHIALAISDAEAQAELSALDAERLDDTELGVAVLDARYEKLTDVLTSRRMFSNVLGAVSSQDVEWENPLQRYPLYTARFLRMYPEHTYEYLNMAYAARVAAEKKEA